MAYSHVTGEECRHIYEWRQEGCKVRTLARLLRRAASSISRKMRRNTGHRGYRPRQAHEMAIERARRSSFRAFTEEMRRSVEKRIRMGETAEMIQGRVRLEGRPMVCKERIYPHVYADAKRGGDLWEHLPRAKRTRHRRCPRKDGRGRGSMPGRRQANQSPLVQLPQQAPT